MCRFIETIRIEGGKVWNLSYHNARMNTTRKRVWGNCPALSLEDILKPEPWQERTSEIRPQPKNVRHESREETRNNRQSEQQNVHTGENRCEESFRTPRKLVRRVVRPATTRPQQKRAEPDPEAKKQRLNIKPAPRPRRVVRPQEIWRS